jgi:muramoyltetrapeptide carboxypeptidase
MSAAELLRPRPLLPGGRIAVLAISSPSKAERIEAAGRNLEAHGFKMEFASNLYDRERSYLAGDDATRAAEINHFLQRDDIDALFFARGGYGAMRILEQIDYDALRRNPRPVVGYSDLTALHQAAARRAGIATFHGPMLNSDFFEGLTPPRHEWMFEALAGRAPMTFTFDDCDVIAEGRAEGVLFGGCLSLTTSLMGTPFDYWIDDGIWFWEDVEEPTYRIDRMLTHLRLSGRLRTIRGVLIGTLKECGEPPFSELDQLLREFFESAGIPVLRNLPFGHAGDNLLMPVGRRVMIDTSTRSLKFDQPVVAVS